MKKISIFLFLLLMTLNTKAQIEKEIFDFDFEGITLNGVLNMPENIEPKGIVLIVHGSGRTNAIAQELHLDIRETIVKSGYATFMWDKKGCGKSGGTFDYNQPVQNSALEVIAAINALKDKQISGSADIGLWGISRAGWINPIVINQYKDIKFWITVSGVDSKENFKYLLEQNLGINGHSKDSVDLIVKEWKEGINITHAGGTYEDYLLATKNLRNNEFITRFNGGNNITESSYYEFQKAFMKETVEEETGLQVYVDNFEMTLSNIECPVLALFGEKDRNVNWTKTKELYESILGRNTDLTVKSFPDGNHNLFKCETGGFYEFQDNNLPWDRCDGFLDVIEVWLMKQE